MPIGKIKKIVAEKGFGFIEQLDGSPDVFVHISAYTGGTPFEQLQAGTEVEFTLGSGPKGPKAENVTLVGA